jgi:hypothetical protein
MLHPEEVPMHALEHVRPNRARSAVILDWLEEEGARRRHPSELWPAPGEPPYPGVAHVGITAAVAAVAFGIFLSWLALSWANARRAGAMARAENLGSPTVTLTARITAVTRQPGGRTVLTVRAGGLEVQCEFAPERLPRWAEPGRLIDIRSLGGWDDVTPAILLDCEVTGGFIEPDGWRE